MRTLDNDIEILTSYLPNNLTTSWDAKSCVLELKEANFQWKQMEWCGWYFEYKVRNILQGQFQIPGDKFNNVSFDMKGAINWDLKAKAIKSDDHRVILNDQTAMEQSIEMHGFHGEVIALCDVEYNDNDRTFQKWHTELKGGKSKYEIQREHRTSVSRYRKTKANLVEIVLLILQKDDLEKLIIMRQGRNSNGAPRHEKYALDIEDIDDFKNYLIKM